MKMLTSKEMIALGYEKQEWRNGIMVWVKTTDSKKKEKKAAKK